MPSETYEFLKNIAKGKYYDRWGGYPDGLISRIYQSKNPSSTRIELKFDDYEFLEVLGVEDDDDKWVWDRFMVHHYYNDNYYDWDRYNQDWVEGYVIAAFNEECMDILKEIMSYLKPEWDINYNQWEDQAKVAEYIDKAYPDDTEELIYVYGTYHMQCTERGVKKELEDETKNVFSRFGIIEEHHAWRYTTTVGILLGLYKLVKDNELDLKDLLKRLIEKYDRTNRGNWYELEYSTWCDDFDSEGQNKDFKFYLEKLLEKVKTTIQEENPNFDEYNKLYDRIIKLGGFNRYIKIPGKDIKVSFEKINPQTNKVTYKIERKTYPRFETRSLSSVDELNTLLYNYELFETIRKIVRNIL